MGNRTEENRNVTIRQVSRVAHHVEETFVPVTDVSSQQQVPQERTRDERRRSPESNSESGNGPLGIDEYQGN